MKVLKLGTTAIASVFALSFAALPAAQAQTQTQGDPGSPPYQQQLAPQDRGGPAETPGAAERPVPPAAGTPADSGMTGAAEPLPGERAPDGGARTVPPGADNPAVHEGGGGGGGGAGN